MPPAARIGVDLHVCPAFNGPQPHVGGPIIGPGVPTCITQSAVQSVMGDLCTCAGPPATVLMGSTTVTVGGKPAARLMDPTAHGGMIQAAGALTVIIGG